MILTLIVPENLYAGTIIVGETFHQLGVLGRVRLIVAKCNTGRI